MAAYPTDSEPFELDDYSRYRLSQSDQDKIVAQRARQAKKAIGEFSYETIRDIGIPGFPRLTGRGLVALARSALNDTPFENEYANLENYDLEHPSALRRGYQRSEVEPDYPAFGTPDEAEAARQEVLMNLVLGVQGGRGGGRGPKGPSTTDADLLSEARQRTLANKEYPVQAAFKTPEGDVIPTGAVHDLSTMPTRLQQDPDQLVSGFTDANKFWPKTAQGGVNPNVFESYRTPLPGGPNYNYRAAPSEQFPNAANMLDPFGGPETIGRVTPGGGLHFKSERYFSRPLNEEMPTSGLPDTLTPETLDAFRRKWLEPPEPPWSAPATPSELPPNFANQVKPPGPPLPFPPSGRKKR